MNKDKMLKHLQNTLEFANRAYQSGKLTKEEYDSIPKLIEEDDFPNAIFDFLLYNYSQEKKMRKIAVALQDAGYTMEEV